MNKASPSRRRALHALTSHIRTSTLNRRRAPPPCLVPTPLPTFMAGTCGVFSLLTLHLPHYSTQIRYPTSGTLHSSALNLRGLLDLGSHTAALGHWYRRPLTPAIWVVILGGHRTTPPHTLVDSSLDLTNRKSLTLHSRTLLHPT